LRLGYSKVIDMEGTRLWLGYSKVIDMEGTRPQKDGASPTQPFNAVKMLKSKSKSKSKHNGHRVLTLKY